MRIVIEDHRLPLDTLSVEPLATARHRVGGVEAPGAEALDFGVQVCDPQRIVDEPLTRVHPLPPHVVVG